MVLGANLTIVPFSLIFFSAGQVTGVMRYN
jgi:hypothetical protein